MTRCDYRSITKPKDLNGNSNHPRGGNPRKAGRQMRRQTEMQGALGLLRAEFPTCVQGPINRPIHNGQPNAAHGKFYFVGRIPSSCYDTSRNNGQGGSKFYDTEQEAIDAAIAGGATRIQNTQCKFVLGS
jgi:hypothetical protein